MSWTVRRVGDLALLLNGFPFDSAHFADSGEVPLVRIRDLTGDDFQTFLPREVVPEAALIQNGDVVIGMDGDFNVTLWSRGSAALNQRLCLLRETGDADLRFLAYALPAHLKRINDLTYATTVKHLSSGQVKAIRLPTPPIREQRAVADYLDRETAQIDTLIEEQQRLLTLTEERRVAVAEDILGGCVGGPQRLRWFIHEVDERAGVAAPALPLLSVSISWGVRRRDEVSDDLPRAEDLSSYKLCRSGDIVLNRMRAFQGALGVAKEDGVVSPDYAVLRCSEALDSEWLGSVMRTGAFVAEMAKRIRGIGSASLGSARTPRINVSDLKQIGLSIPRMADQRLQLADLTERTLAIEKLRAAARDVVSLARERRAALITAAVTGKIDVGAAA